MINIITPVSAWPAVLNEVVIMIPVVTLVGRPNTGKSTLFNCLTRTRDALVADFPGLTRDRKYGYAEWEGHKFIVIDTGGMYSTEEGVECHIGGQSLVAIEEANIVVFMVDGRTGLLAADQAIAKHLRRCQKKTIIVANKTDGINVDSAVSDFYALGMGNIIPIAASHGRGISNLLEQILLPLVNNSQQVVDTEKPRPCLGYEAGMQEEGEGSFDENLFPIKLAIIGRPNVGKSTLTNCILGEKRVIVYEMPGTTRDSIYIPMVRAEQKYILIDTAGVRKRGRVIETIEKFSVIKTMQAIDNANVVLLVIDACENISDQDLSLLGVILQRGRSLVIAINKWDNILSTTRNEIRNKILHRLGFIDFVKVHFISALHNRGISNLFQSINEAYQCATKRVNTALLTRIMHMALDLHPPPRVHGRLVKPKYAHAGGYNPPLIVIHGTQVKYLQDSYKRYLINYFRRALEIRGTPVSIQFNETHNPFTGRSNTLTLRQLRKRKRLIRHIKKK